MTIYDIWFPASSGFRVKTKQKVPLSRSEEKSGFQWVPSRTLKNVFRVPNKFFLCRPQLTNTSEASRFARGGKLTKIPLASRFARGRRFTNTLLACRSARRGRLTNTSLASHFARGERLTKTP